MQVHHDTRKWLRYLALVAATPHERAYLEALAEHWHALPLELRAVLAHGWFWAELPPKYRVRRAPPPSQ